MITFKTGLRLGFDNPGTYSCSVERSRYLKRLGRQVLGVLGLCLVMSGCGATRTPTVRATERPLSPTGSVSDPSASGDGVHHVVRPGETLWRIATAYGLSVDELARANRLEDPGVLTAGDTLRIPGAREILKVSPLPSRPGFDWPVRGGEILSYFGAQRRDHRHKGLDIRGRHGQPVLATDDGRIVYSGSSMRGYGKTVIIDHGDRLRSLYAHNSSLLVREGDRVRRGQMIARVGRTGNATTEHCHFEIHENERAVDPLEFLTAGSRP